MKPWSHAPTALAFIIGSWGATAHGQSNAELLNELRELKERVLLLEGQLKANPSPATESPSAKPQWGMTPEQIRALNRVTVKVGALEENLESAGFQGLKISGYVDPVFIYNRAQHRSGFQFLNDIGQGGYSYDNSFIGSAVLDLQKETLSGTQWRLTLMPNRGAGSGLDTPSIVHQATTSIPITDNQTRFIAGQMPDWSGYELLPANQNKLVTHNLLFDFTLPFAYTGAGVDITRGKWMVKAMMANMNASKQAAGDTAPVLAYRVDYSRGEFQGFGFAGVHGKAANARATGNNPISGLPYDPGQTKLNLFEFDAYFIRGDWTVQGQFSTGHQAGAAITPDAVDGSLRAAQWWGLSGLVAYKWTPRLEGVIRADLLNNHQNGGGLLGYSVADDVNGIGPDANLNCATTFTIEPRCHEGSRRVALTLGLNYMLNLNAMIKAEYRMDQASQPVFWYQRDGSYRKTNHLLGTSLVVFF